MIKEEKKSHHPAPQLHQVKIAFITNFCSHYAIKLFELIAQKYDTEFYFTGGQEGYWEKKNKLWTGHFNGKYLKGFHLFPKIKITPGLLNLLLRKYDVFIKTIDDRFALPFTFLLSKILRKPFILWTGIWAHPQTLIHKTTYCLTRYLYQHADAIVTYGDHVKEYLVNLGIEGEKIFCAYHSTDNSIYNKTVFSEEKQKLRESLGLKKEKIIIFVGRLEACKGLNYLTEAAAGIQEPKVCLVFLGEGPQRETIEEDCKRWGIEYRFLNYVNNQELYRYYAMADVFVLTSITTKDFKEPWGIVINEAMNQGCPVVATDAVGAAMGGLVENGINGLIVPEKDSFALRHTLETILTNDQIRQSMGEAARRKIEGWTPGKTSEGFFLAVEYVLGKYS